MAQRLVRAKREISQAHIRFQVPETQHLADRIDGVLKVLHLIFTEGYAATVEDRLIREDLCQEAIRLTRQLEQWLRVTRTNLARAQTAEVLGLLALMLLHEGRRPAWLSQGAVVQVRGPRAALGLIAPLEEALGGYASFFLVRAQWKDQIGDITGADADYLRSLDFLGNPAERPPVLERLAKTGASLAPTGSGPGVG